MKSLCATPCRDPFKVFEVFMKKLVKAFSLPALSILMSLTLIAPATSQAALSTMGSTAAVVKYVVVGLLAATAAGVSASESVRKEHPKFFSFFDHVFIPAVIVVIALDDSGNSKAMLTPASDDVASKAGLTAQEAQAYNAELEIAQQVFDQVSADVAIASEQDRGAAAKASWEKYRGALSADAFNGLMKLMAAAN
jgi:hypothetical protein